jgi:hypothetical protein
VKYGVIVISQRLRFVRQVRLPSLRVSAARVTRERDHDRIAPPIAASGAAAAARSVALVRRVCAAGRNEIGGRHLHHPLLRSPARVALAELLSVEADTTDATDTATATTVVLIVCDIAVAVVIATPAAVAVSIVIKTTAAAAAAAAACSFSARRDNDARVLTDGTTAAVNEVDRELNRIASTAAATAAAADAAIAHAFVQVDDATT